MVEEHRVRPVDDRRVRVRVLGFHGPAADGAALAAVGPRPRGTRRLVPCAQNTRVTSVQLPIRELKKTYLFPQSPTRAG